LIERTHSVAGIGGYKVGSILVIRYGLPSLISAIRGVSDLPVIYDHQKAMTDIPSLGKDFAQAVKTAGADAVIGFPQAGPTTQEQWIKACNEEKLRVIIGGEMTHPNYVRSENGYIANEALDEIYLLAAKLGIKDFVVPGNKIDRISHYRELLHSICGGDLVFYSPGLITQGGKITDAAKVAGDSWHAIVGRAIYNAVDITLAAKETTREILT
jgi:orotidine-5'-phosphate decarboxylase